MTAPGKALDRIVGDVGDLVARHESARGLDAFSRYADDPVGFIREVLDGDPWERQIEIAESVRDRPLVLVQSANAVGKDWTAARLALWWAVARRGLALVTGPTERQVREVVMGEVARAFRKAVDLPGELYTTALRLGGDDAGGILAFTSTEASRLTGFHAPRVLGILTEAQAVEDFAYEGVLSCATRSEDRVLAVGNPLAPRGRFYASSRSSAWKTIRIPASDHPNLREDRDVIPGGPSMAFVERIRREYGPESPQYVARVDARFPEQAEDALISQDALDAASDSDRVEDFVCEVEDRAIPAVVGVDVAREGEDRTAVVVRRGRVVWSLRRYRETDTVENARRIRDIVRDLVDNGKMGVSAVVVDETALGGGVHDSLKRLLRDVTWYEPGLRGLYPRLREVGPRLVGFKASRRAPQPERFADTKSQAFWRLRDEFERDRVAFRPDLDPALLDDLKDELLAHAYRYQNDDRVRIGGKDEVRRVLGRSPDLADAFSMTYQPDLKADRVRRIRIA